MSQQTLVEVCNEDSLVNSFFNSLLLFVLCAHVKPTSYIANYKCKTFMKLTPDKIKLHFVADARKSETHMILSRLRNLNLKVFTEQTTRELISDFILVIFFPIITFQHLMEKASSLIHQHYQKVQGDNQITMTKRRENKTFIRLFLMAGPLCLCFII